MEISFCVIVRNNQDTVNSCLDSVKGNVEEIIVVDTGSADNTLEIAKKFTDKIFYLKWNDDFSAAKNFAIEKAKYPWILFLDSDEAISKEDILKLKELAEKSINTTSGFSLIQRNYLNKIGSFGFVSCKDDPYKESKIASGYVPRRMVRFFKNHPKIRFEGSIHESVEKSILKVGKIQETGIPIHHYGMLKNTLDKTRHYIEMEKKVAKDDFFQDYKIAIQLHSINEKEEAIEYLKKSIEKNPVFALSWLELGIIMLENNDLEKAKVALHKSESFAIYSMTYDHLGILYGKLGELSKSADYFKKAINLSPYNADLHFNLGLTYHQLRNKKGAFLAFKKAVELNPEYKKMVNFD